MPRNFPKMAVWIVLVRIVYATPLAKEEKV